MKFKVGDIVNYIPSKWNFPQIEDAQIECERLRNQLYIVVKVITTRGATLDKKKYRIYGQIDQKTRDVLGVYLEKYEE